MWAIWHPRIKGKYSNSKSYCVSYFHNPWKCIADAFDCQVRSKTIFYECGSVDGNVFYLTWGWGTVCKGPNGNYFRLCEPEVSVVKTHLCCHSAKAAVDTMQMNRAWCSCKNLRLKAGVRYQAWALCSQLQSLTWVWTLQVPLPDEMAPRRGCWVNRNQSPCSDS